MKKIILLLVISIVSCTDHGLDDLSSYFVDTYGVWTEEQFSTQTIWVTITARDHNYVDFLHSSHKRNFDNRPDEIFNVLVENVLAESRGDTLRLNNDYVRNGVKGKMTGVFVRRSGQYYSAYYNLKAVEKGLVVFQHETDLFW